MSTLKTITINEKEIFLPRIGINFQPNEQQVLALNMIAKQFEGPNFQTFTLKGYAGTGKTSVVKIFLEYLRSFYSFDYIAVTAPTHRAKQVIESLSKRECQTIHSILGLMPDLNIERLDHSNLVFNKKSEPSIPRDGILIIDESSMVNDVLFDTIIDKCKEFNTKVLFIGDSAQLKPVKQDHISLVFSIENSYELTQVERQDGDNPLCFIYDSIRSDMNSTVDLFKRETNLIDNKGIEFLSIPQDFLERSKELFLDPRFRDDKNFNRILAFKNKKVTVYNSIIRKALGYRAPFQVGELLMAYDNFKVESREDPNVFCKIVNSCDYEVLVSKPFNKELEGKYFPGFNLELRCVQTKSFHRVFILDKDITLEDRTYLAECIEIHRLNALFGSKEGRKGAWWPYYGLLNSFCTTFPLFLEERLIKDRTFDYGYAHTIHRSQGGQYTNVCVDERDIDSCLQHELRNQLKYVSFSRPIDKCVVFCESKLLF